MKKIITILFLSAFAATGAVAQSVSKGLKASGYIQLQNQWGGQAASLKVGTPNEDPEKPFNRFGIRRGRMKFTYETGLASAIFQLDITEKGVGFKDAYVNLKDPWIGTMALKGGVFDRPFGYEISYSSSQRESPERSTVFQTLFPEERDLGAMLVLQAPGDSPWNMLKLEAGLFAGNGIKQETDSKRDFIGHLSALKKWDNAAIGGGVSYYRGSVYQGTQNVYAMSGKEFVLDADERNEGRFAKREYMGFDAELSLESTLGTTKLHGEYLFGQQPGTASKTTSPNSVTLPATDTYIRDFNGGYVMLVQQLGKSPVSVVGKYDWYDPNTRIAGDEVGHTKTVGDQVVGNGTSVGDLSQNTVGVGAFVAFNPGMRLTAYYEINTNERSSNIDGFDTDRKNNVFTLRLQHKF